MQNPYKDFSQVDPQPNEHFRQIENSVFWAVINAGFSGPEYQLLLCVIDKTWGYGKTTDAISLSQFEKATGLEKRNVAHYLDKLEKSHVIIVQKGGPGRGNMSLYMFNKYWDTWKLEKVLAIHPLLLNGVQDTPFTENPLGEHQLASKGVQDTPLPNSVQGTPLDEGKGVDSAGKGVKTDMGKGVWHTPTKESTTKETYKRKQDLNKPPSEHQCSDEGLKLAGLLKSLILRNNEKAKTPDDLKKWAVDIDRMMTIEHRTPEEIRVIIEFSQADTFWCANILSAGKLREKYDTLYLRRKEKEKSSAEEKKKGDHYEQGRSGAPSGANEAERSPGADTGRGLSEHGPDSQEDSRFKGWKVRRSGTDEA